MRFFYTWLCVSALLGCRQDEAELSQRRALAEKVLDERLSGVDSGSESVSSEGEPHTTADLHPDDVFQILVGDGEADLDGLVGKDFFLIFAFVIV